VNYTEKSQNHTQISEELNPGLHRPMLTSNCLSYSTASSFSLCRQLATWHGTTLYKL